MTDDATRSAWEPYDQRLFNHSPSMGDDGVLAAKLDASRDLIRRGALDGAVNALVPIVADSARMSATPQALTHRADVLRAQAAALLGQARVLSGEGDRGRDDLATAAQLFAQLKASGVPLPTEAEVDHLAVLAMLGDLDRALKGL
jgi:hypothetical protein